MAWPSIQRVDYERFASAYDGSVKTTIVVSLLDGSSFDIPLTAAESERHADYGETFVIDRVRQEMRKRYGDNDEDDMGKKNKKGGAEDIVWTSESGKRMRVAEMGDDHVRNAHRMMRLRANDHWAKAGAANMFPAGPAKALADRAVAEWTECALAAETWVRVFDKELERRKLKPRPLTD